MTTQELSIAEVEEAQNSLHSLAVQYRYSDTQRDNYGAERVAMKAHAVLEKVKTKLRAMEAGKSSLRRAKLSEGRHG